MKKKRTVLICLLGLIAILLIFKTGQKSPTLKLESDYKIKIEDIQECTNQPFEYDKRGNSTIYLICANEIKLKDEKKEFTLYEYLDQKDKKLDDLLDDLTSRLELQNEEDIEDIKIYKDSSKKVSEDSLYLLKCENKDNKNIYFSKEEIDEEKALNYCSIDKTQKEYPFTIETSEKKSCSNEQVLYLRDGNRNIYINCLDKIKIKEKGKTAISLDKYYLEDKDIIDKMISYMEASEHLNDGGTTIYRDTSSKELSKNGLTIIKCNTVEKNNDIYIGPASMKYKQDFCKRK